MKAVTVGIDLAKQVFQIHGIDPSILVAFHGHASAPSPTAITVKSAVTRH